jgi:TolB-like protein/Tfp pilus assembly protein PilF
MSSSGPSGWLHRVRERGVIRVAASYAVIAWLLLQIADVTFEPLGVPRWVMVSLIVAAVLGFPVAIALAWFYEASDAGVARDTAPAGAARPVVHGARRHADLAIIGVLLVAVAVLLVRQSAYGPQSAGAAIAVLPFANLSTVPEGEVLASGIAESVLHQIASLAQLDVISRTSSFAFRERAADAREIGRKLGARYLLEGSVQSDRARMRVTTQLIDTETGADVWSMRFDRRPGDIFVIQDEIAVQVTRALELSVDRKAIERMTGQGTTNLKAYLEFLQGRSLLANTRVVDARDASERFEEATRLDPNFAAAYVGQAEAELFLAEYDVTDDREARFRRALARGKELVEKALALDPDNGDAYLQRAYLTAFDDLASAEADYRRGLELSPNSAKGHAGLAAVLYETPARRDETLELLDRARKLDPLEPAYDVTKAVFLMYERGDPQAATDLLAEVLSDHPQYVPALLRNCEFLGWGKGRFADAILNCERALAIDPQSEEARRHLVRSYLDLDDVAAARELADLGGHQPAEIEAVLAMRAHDWERAAELAYRSIAQRTVSANMLGTMLVAIRMHARTAGEAHRARLVIEELAGVVWDATGRPTIPGGSPLRDTAVALADLLILDGDQERGRRLLAELIAKWRDEVGRQGRPELWYFRWHPVALALNNDRSEAIAMLERALARRVSYSDWWSTFDMEPAYDQLRKDPRFVAVVRKVSANFAEQRRILDRMREEGLVPARGSGAG